MDLFTSVVPPERFHPKFAKIIEKRNPYDEAVLMKWAEGFVDRDRKFVEEFQMTFNSSFWELYLHAILKEAGCKIRLTLPTTRPTSWLRTQCRSSWKRLSR
jgi:hypothetical protein